MKTLWTASLLLICCITIVWTGCCITIVWTGCNLAGVVLPDMVVRIMGLLDLCAIPVLVYSTIRIRKSK